MRRMVIDGQGAVTTTMRMNAFGETRHSGEGMGSPIKLGPACPARG
jgi:hypothetical protein